MEQTDKTADDKNLSLRQVAAKDLNSLKEGIAEVAKVKVDVAEYFCEDPNAFKLEECFKILCNFCSRWKVV